MKTRITLLIASVALLTLSFTFVGGQADTANLREDNERLTTSSPVGGIVADEVVK